MAENNSDNLSNVTKPVDVEEIDDFEFIAEYKERECLYNIQIAAYRNRYCKERSYKQLAEKFSTDVGKLRTIH